MSEDILFDNIYVGHSVADAKQLAAETFEVKHPLEKAQSKIDDTPDEDDVTRSWKEDPIAFIREKVFSFIELAKIDPVLAFKTKPETGAALTGALLTLFGMLGAVFGLIGAQQKPITKVGTILFAFCHIDLNPFACSPQKRRMPRLQTIRRRMKRHRWRVFGLVESLRICNECPAQPCRCTFPSMPEHQGLEDRDIVGDARFTRWFPFKQRCQILRQRKPLPGAERR